MITKIILTFFKRHENLTIDFTEGMVALRGANEAGKSTIYHAILYAMFGARALPLSVSETVTYGHPDSALKVHLEFQFEGKLYTIDRSTRGAQLACGSVTANGQAEVTKFVEALFKVNADAATKIMIASQNGLRGALESGDAVPLIEKLANISLIDELIDKVQNQLPSGNTKALVESLAGLEELAEPVLDLSDLAPTVEFCKSVLSLATLTEEKIAKQRSAIDEAGARAVIASYTSTKQSIEQASKSLEQNLARIATPPAKPAADVSGLKAAQAAQTIAVQRYEAFKQFQKYLPAEHQQYLNGVEPEVFRQAAKDKALAAAAAQKLLIAEIAGKTAMLITDKECGLCGKQLDSVEEVVAKNSRLRAEIAAAEQALSNEQFNEKSAQADLDLFVGMARVNAAAVNGHAMLKAYTTLSAGFPADLAWVGGYPDAVVQIDYNTQIQAAEQAETAYQRALAVQAEVSASVTRLQAELSGLTLDQIGYTAAQATLEELTATTLLLQSQVAEVGKARLALKDAETAVAVAQQKYDTELTAYRAAMVNKAKLQATLAEYQKNNALIKKLREARPIVAAKLWAIVLSSVSQHFSQIRGTPSIVTRDANRFLVDGHNSMGLSGSTLDALGLAIRVALGKTFLPSVSFLLLDEPAAGMSDERETAMLGLLATLDYDQVVVVTHSPLADSFATSVVAL